MCVCVCVCGGGGVGGGCMHAWDDFSTVSVLHYVVLSGCMNILVRAYINEILMFRCVQCAPGARRCVSVSYRRIASRLSAYDAQKRRMNTQKITTVDGHTPFLSTIDMLGIQYISTIYMLTGLALGSSVGWLSTRSVE